MGADFVSNLLLRRKYEIGERRPSELLVAAGHAADRRCNVPQQLGVGTKGGAEIIVAGVRTHLGLHPDHAVASDDKKNGFNSIYLSRIWRSSLQA